MAARHRLHDRMERSRHRPLAGERDAPARAAGSRVPESARAVIEPAFGHSFENIRIHHDDEAASSAESLGASAYTVGSDVFFARDAWDPSSPEGVHRLAHELAHTVQQGGVGGGEGVREEGDWLAGVTLGEAPSLAINDSGEAEARAAADAVLSGGSASLGSALVSAPAVLREAEEEKETEAQRAQRLVGQYPWMRSMFPDWAVSLGGSGLSATKSDGMTALTRNADISLSDGFSANMGQRRVTETDKDHMMASEHNVGWKDGMAFVDWLSGGKSLADDGTKVADEAKRRVSLGPGGGAYSSSISETRDTVTTKSNKEISYKDGEFNATYDREREFALDDDHKLGSKTGAKFGSSGASLNRENSSRIKDVETGAVEGERTSKGFGWDKDKGLNASYVKENTTEIDGQAFNRAKGAAYSDGNVTLTSTKGQGAVGTKPGEGATSTTNSFTAGADGVSVAQSRIDDKGNTTSMSMGGNMSLGEDGMPSSISGNVGFSRNGKSVKLSGGYEVTASEPQAVGQQFVVEWKRTLNAGAGGSAKGVGANASHADSQFGTKVFRTKEEAEHFRNNLSSMIPSASEDPATVSGAMHLGIGESRGSGDSSSAGLSASVSPTGGSIGVGMSSTDSNSSNVRRVDPTTFEIRNTVGTQDAKSLSASTLGGVGATGHAEKDKAEIVTVRVDVSTDQGKAAFEAFSGSGLILPGATVIRRTSKKGEGSGTTVDLGLATHDRSGRTEEALTYDEKGNKIEHYMGTATESYAGKYSFMKEKFDQNVRFDASEVNDTNRYYSIGGSAYATEGKKSAELLGELTNSETRDATNAKSSGRWGVEVQITQEMVEQFMKTMEEGKVREEGIFEGDPRNALRAQLQGSADMGDKMRAMSKFFADYGHDGKAIRAMTDTLYGVANQWSLSTDYDMRKKNKLGNFQYDLTLEGDKNFQGSGARLSLEKKMSDLQKAIDLNPAAAGTLHGSVRDLLKEVRRQRSEVGDEKRYTDMPDESKQMLRRSLARRARMLKVESTRMLARRTARRPTRRPSNSRNCGATSLAWIATCKSTRGPSKVRPRASSSTSTP